VESFKFYFQLQCQPSKVVLWDGVLLKSSFQALPFPSAVNVDMAVRANLQRLTVAL